MFYPAFMFVNTIGMSQNVSMHFF